MGDAKKKKKHTGLIVVLILVIVLFIGCAALSSGSSSSDEERGTKEITQQTETTAGESVGSTAESAQAPAEDSTAAETTAETAAEETASSDTTIEEQTLFSAEGVTVIAKEYVTDTVFGDGIRLEIDNDSDKDVGVGCTTLIVNDYMISDLFAEEVAAGKKSNETLDLYSNELESAGISNVGQIEIYFHLYDPDTYETTYTADKVTIKTNHFDDMDTSPNDDGQELYNQDGIRIVGRYVDEDDIWGTGIVLYLENKTDKNVVIQCDDMSINGYMVTPYFSSTVYAGKMAVDEITILQSDLDENGITSVDDVQLVFNISDADTYMPITQSDKIDFTTK